ncbi:putative Na+/H+ antiporter [Verrucomicrobiaceae bacterium R5-34]|uniref:Na+/H+ antiporter n=1 Tax=Oceaniferula flava TaxID=2800421 RepID=A0AAE2S9Y2_9BACT|nr:putative Na+/H+ antiporter [Oceaniferula flavus]MBK1829381.1 putative Na+/H+ antiporter [Verrucomicrobiaceae bacterium R5-34]MBK1853609.1 putative Na+/H+ antiporter [Oceaniferula flavus]MBM1134914.1 putative Na+/H+ antiporter [Oceaniferula flavus]
MRTKLLPLLLLLFTFAVPTLHAAAGAHAKPEFVERMEHFPAEEEAAGMKGIGEILSHRASEQPFLLVATIIFVLAITHTFFAVPLTKYSHKLQHEHDAMIRREKEAAGESATAQDMVSFKATFFHFLGEIEAIFGIWVIALIAAIIGFYDVDTVKSYITTVNFTEPMFVVIIMALASTRPVLRFAESALSFFAKWGKETPSAWWLSILIVAPILGSFITEPGAMTIAAMLLAKKFYKLKPSPKLAYGTLGLLFVNISVGGVLTNFAAPPVLMVAQKWGLTTPEMFMHFGDKAIIGILLSTGLYYGVFRKELASLSGRLEDHDGDGKGDLQDDHSRTIPLWITLTHLFFMAWTVFFAHTPALFIGGFLFFLAFRQGTAHHQFKMELKGPILVGFFLAGLVIHGGLQGWWLAPIITSLTEWPLFAGSVLLTSFNDNAAITFLASQVSGLGPELKYAVLAGAVCGGGLTVIANAPNPAGQALLSRFFGDGVSPGKLLMGAFVPTVIVSLVMMLFPDATVDRIFDKEKPLVEEVEETPQRGLVSPEADPDVKADAE